MNRRWKKAVVVVLRIAILVGSPSTREAEPAGRRDSAVSGGAPAILKASTGAASRSLAGDASQGGRAGRGGPERGRSRTESRPRMGPRPMGEPPPAMDIAATDVEGFPPTHRPRRRPLLSPSWDSLALRTPRLYYARLGIRGVRSGALLDGREDLASYSRRVDTVPFWTLVRLHYLGFFFNTFMPGGVGGDIIKTVYLARHSPRKRRGHHGAHRPRGGSLWSPAHHGRAAWCWPTTESCKESRCRWGQSRSS